MLLNAGRGRWGRGGLCQGSEVKIRIPQGLWMGVSMWHVDFLKSGNVTSKIALSLVEYDV